MSKSKILFLALISFIGGIFYQSFWSVSLFLVWLILIGLIIFLVFNYKNRSGWIMILLVTLFFLGILRIVTDLNKIKNIDSKPEYINQEVKIVKEPEKKEYYQNLIVQNLKNISWKKGRSDKILVRTELYKNFNYGDVIELKCQPQIVENISSEFDYKMYLAKDGIYYICPKADIVKIKTTEKSLYGLIFKFRKKLEENINKVIPQPEAALANGVIFGGSSRLSKELQEKFSLTGMTHIVAVSGYNVTIIAEYLMILGILLGFWRQQAFYFAALGIFIFIAMIGFPSSALRAGVMGTLILWAIKNGRLANLDNAILLAGAIMLLVNPLLLRWDIGFQLSFLATIGLIKLSPFWDNYLSEKHKLGGFLEIILMTISAQLFVLPIIMYNFHNLSIISLVANVLILPIVPITMLFVFLTAFGGLIFFPLSLGFGYLAYFLLKYEISIIELLASMRFSSLKIDNFGIWGLIGWYGILMGIIYLIDKKIKWKTKN